MVYLLFTSLSYARPARPLALSPGFANFGLFSSFVLTRKPDDSSCFVSRFLKQIRARSAKGLYFEAFVVRLHQVYPGIVKSVVSRFCRRYL